MKNLIQYTLQKVLGFGNYLLLFSIITIKRISKNPNEQDFMHFIGIIPDEGLILDIGANIGITTVPLAKNKPNATIYSFEPMPENAAALRRVIRYFGVDNVEVFQTALGEAEGELNMVMPIVNKVKKQGLSYISSGHTNQTNIGSETRVRVKKLDDILEVSSAPKVSAIKIDVENFEYYVLKGALNILTKHKPIIYCELWADEKRQTTIDYLTAIGYQVKIYEVKSLKDYDGQDRINFFFIPTESA